MKSFVILIILAALGLFGTAFFGVYTAPGLEELPTYESLRDGKDKKKGKAGNERPAGIFPVNSGGKVDQRNNYLKRMQQEVDPGS
jgi:hypothetical protein